MWWVWQRHWHSTIQVLFSYFKWLNCLFWLYAIKQHQFFFLPLSFNNQIIISLTLDALQIQTFSIIFLFLSSNNQQTKWEQKKCSSTKRNRFLLNFPKSYEFNQNNWAAHLFPLKIELFSFCFVFDIESFVFLQTKQKKNSSK